MPWAQKTKDGIDNWFTAKDPATQRSWTDRIADWLVGGLARGFYKGLADMEPGALDGIKTHLTTIRNDPNFPDDLKPFIDKALVPGNPLLVAGGLILVVFYMLGAVSAILEPPLKALSMKVDRGVQTFRLDPGSIMTAWRRDPDKYAFLIDDLREQGWSEAKIEALKFFTQFMPSAQDLVTWEAREVFEPAMIAKYGLDDEFENLDLTLFGKIGVTREQALNYWRAHWEHASWLQVVEMLRRGQLTEADIWDWFRLVEIPPYWRDKLIAISWNVPTRVDVRRFWEMRTIDEARLREVYTALGYHGKDLDDYVLWTKIYVDFPDLITRFKNGWLSLDEVRSELIRLGMSSDRAEELIQTKVKAAASEKTAAQKDLTMSQIVKGVKKAVISRDEGNLLLQDMGYDPYEAEYILAIEIPQDEVVTEVKIRELTKTDVLNGLKAGVITEDQALDKLLSLRYTLDDARFLLNIYLAMVTPPTETKAKEASKADIVKAVKTGLITAEDGYLMLQDTSFTPEASQFILMVQAESSPFSPMSFAEFKDLTTKFQLAAGKEVTAMPPELLKAADELVRLTKEVEDLNRSIEVEKRLRIATEVLPEGAQVRLTELQVTRNRAVAELERVKSEYDRLVAEWKHKEAPKL